MAADDPSKEEQHLKVNSSVSINDVRRFDGLTFCDIHQGVNRTPAFAKPTSRGRITLFEDSLPDEASESLDDRAKLGGRRRGRVLLARTALVDVPGVPGAHGVANVVDPR